LPSDAKDIVGLATTPTGFGMINSDDDNSLSEITIIYLDRNCKETNTSPETWARKPRDPSDLVFSNGSYYLCDCASPTGQTRPTIAMEKVTPNGAGAAIYRYTFPGGGNAVDTKAMVLTSAGLPIFFATDNGIYTTANLGTDGDTTGQALTKAGTFTPMTTNTPTAVTNGGSIITGAALSPDGSKVVIRTYSDAYEYHVVGGDVAASITDANLIGVTPLPNETKGESITYSTDGTQFITAPRAAGGTMLIYQPWIKKTG
jgi:hypothetical protein